MPCQYQGEASSPHTLRPRPDCLSRPLEKFISMAQAVGCNVAGAKSKDETDIIIKETYPEAKVIASNLKEVKAATLNPDLVPDARALNGTDVGVVKGEPRSGRERRHMAFSDHARTRHLLHIGKPCGDSARTPRGEQHARSLQGNLFQRLWLRHIHSRPRRLPT